MNFRLTALENLKNSAFYGPSLKKVNVELIREFCITNATLSHGEFERAAQRMFLDKLDRPRNWSTIEDILIAINHEAERLKKQGGFARFDLLFLGLALLALVGCGSGSNSSNRGMGSSIRLVSYGDSITFGANTTPYNTAIAQVKGYTPVNRGVPGMRMTDYEAWVAMTADSQPTDIITIMLCENDMRFAGTDSQYEQSFKAAAVQNITWLQARGAKVYVGGCLKMLESSYQIGGQLYDQGSDEAVDEYNQILQDVVNQIASPNVIYVDVNSAYSPSASTLQSDMVHPNNLGQSEIATAFLNKM